MYVHMSTYGGGGGGRAEVNRALALARKWGCEADAVIKEARATGSSTALEELLREPGWRGALEGHMQSGGFQRLGAFVGKERAPGGPPVFPPAASTFAAFHATPLDRVRVVILGQDPYHGPGQATGLSFSVPRGCPPPPSLRNMFKELASDVPGFRPPGADFQGQELLARWAAQGVLLLNSCLTVRRAQAASHAGKGWEEFTDAALRELSNRREGVVFLLWGKFAEKKGRIVDRRRHHVLTAHHPSPLSAYRGFFGCKHFSKANALLEEQGHAPIDWDLGVKS